MNNINSELTVNQYSAITLLMTGKNRTEVANTLDIHISTLDQWIKTPTFKRIQREAAITVYEESLAVIVNLTTKAVYELEKILEDVDVPARTKLTAIGLILSHAEKCKSYELEQRLERIESVLNNTSYLEINASVKS